MSIADQESAAQLRRVTIVKAPNGTQCLAVPGAISAVRDNADVIKWVNRTGGTVTLFLPGPVSGAPIAAQIEDGADKNINVVEGSVGVYEYQIYCTVTNTYARGNSSPIVIIE